MKNKIDKSFFYTLTSLVVIIAIGLFLIRSSHVFENYSSTDFFGQLVDVEVTEAATFENVASESNDNFLIIYDANDDVSLDTESNTKKLLEYMKKKSDSYDKDVYVDFYDYKAVIIAFESLDEYAHLQQLYYYVANGGNLIIAQRPYMTEEIEMYNELFGIKSYEGFKETLGMKLLSNLLITGEGLEVNEAVSNHSIDVNLYDDVIVHATDLSGEPLIWENNFGYGKVIFNNGQMLVEKGSRGIYSGMLSLIGDAFIYPIVNSKVMFIDDFPCPIPTKTEDIIYDEYKKKTPDFFRDVWWPDMVAISKKYDVLYTGYYIETYKAAVTDLDNNGGEDIDKQNIITYGRELLKIGGEIGMHGFNHQPLAVGENKASEKFGYVTWGSIEDMADGIERARYTLEDIFPKNTIVSYVPPSNIITEEGIEALKQALPDLKIISSVYAGDEEDAYIQELEIREDGLLNFPRMSYGYIDTKEVEYDILTSLTTFGLIAHFIHGDDVLDDERSFGLKWSELIENFEAMMKRIYTTLPWVDSMTTAEAGANIVNYLEQEVAFKYEENRIVGALKNYKNNGNYILKTKKPIKNTINCSYKLIDDNTYLITNDNAEFIIELGE